MAEIFTAANILTIVGWIVLLWATFVERRRVPERPFVHFAMLTIALVSFGTSLSIRFLG